jgi:hypothetical protein
MLGQEPDSGLWAWGKARRLGFGVVGECDRNPPNTSATCRDAHFDAAELTYGGVYASCEGLGQMPT